MSMGWLTESALALKAAKPVAVDSGSIVDLKAALFQRESEVRQSVSLSVSADGAAARFRAVKRTPLDAAAPGTALSGSAALHSGAGGRGALGGGSNRGVEERNARDRALNAAEQRSAAEALSKKAALYETLTRGAVSDERTRGSFLVDFESKGWLREDEAAAAAEEARKAKAAADSDDSDAEDAVERDTDPRSRAQRKAAAASAAAAAAAVAAEAAADDRDRHAMAMERREWERKAMREILDDRLVSERALTGPDSGIKQNYEKSLTAEEKRLLADVSAATAAARDKRVTAERKRKHALQLRAALLAAKNDRKRQRIAAGAPVWTPAPVTATTAAATTAAAK